MAEYFNKATFLYAQCQTSFSGLVTASSPNRDADTVRCQVAWELYRLGLWGESARISHPDTACYGQIPSGLESLNWKLIAHTLQVLSSIISDPSRMMKRYHLEVSSAPLEDAASTSTAETSSTRLTRLFQMPASGLKAHVGIQKSGSAKVITFSPLFKPHISNFFLDIATLNSHLLSLLPASAQSELSSFPVKLQQSAFLNAKDVLDLEIIRQNLDITRRNRAAAAKQRWKDLLRAIEKDNMFIVQLSIACGVKLNGDEREEEESPLMTAVRWNRLSIGKLLVDFGADPNIQCTSNPGGQTPLHLASQSASSELLTWLLSLLTPASKISTDWQGRSALFNAAMYGNTDALGILLSEPVLKRIETTDNNGCTALWMAASSGHFCSLKALLDAYPEDLNTCNAGDGPPLVGAVRGESKHCVSMLLKRNGIVVDGVDSEGRSALHHAATRSIYIMDQLRAMGANAKLTDNNGMTCLAVAVDKGCVTETRHLLTWPELDFDAVGKRGSALCIAAKADEMELAGMLLRVGADVEGCDERGRTALILAAEAGHDDMTRLLCRYGARRERVDKIGFTAEDWARVGKKKGVLRVLGGL
jgi:ankyrin repeat protein